MSLPLKSKIEHEKNLMKGKGFDPNGDRVFKYIKICHICNMKNMGSVCICSPLLLSSVFYDITPLILKEN